MKWLLIDLWLISYSIEFQRLTNWSFKDVWQYGEATMENFEYDLEDLGCPIDMASEDLSCWSD